MKINNISSTQFAGIRNIDIPLEDGLNVIYGKTRAAKVRSLTCFPAYCFKIQSSIAEVTRTFLNCISPASKKQPC